MDNDRLLIWGCDFDPNPDMYSIRRKLYSFLVNEGVPKYSGPYDVFVKNQTLFPDLNSIFAGKYACPSYLSATPDFKEELYPETYRLFINSGGCRELAYGFGEHVRAQTPPGRIPVTFGVDHCLTGGLYRALADGCSEAVLVVLDRHLDAISPRCRNQMVGYSIEQENEDVMDTNEVEYYGQDFYGNYDTGSFLRYLLEDGVLDPSNLLILGIQDAPPAWLRTINDSRITDYLNEYDSLLSSGASVITFEALRNKSYLGERKDLQSILAERPVYLSFDVDVFEGLLGSVARYNGSDGLSLNEAESLLSWLGLKEAHMLGMDIMELDVNTMLENSANEKEIADDLGGLLQSLQLP